MNYITTSEELHGTLEHIIKVLHDQPIKSTNYQTTIQYSEDCTIIFDHEFLVLVSKNTFTYYLGLCNHHVSTIDSIEIYNNDGEFPLSYKLIKNCEEDDFFNAQIERDYGIVTFECMKMVETIIELIKIKHNS